MQAWLDTPITVGMVLQGAAACLVILVLVRVTRGRRK